MRCFSILATSLAFAMGTTAATADSFVYIVNGSQQFGTVNLTTGSFHQIGAAQPEAGSFGLAATPSGSFVTFAYSGNVYSINPATGAPSLAGPSGLDDCSTVFSPCGPTSASTLGNLGPSIYATDLQNSLYAIDSLTGAAFLIGPTGIPAVPYIPGSMNSDGSFNFYDETIFGEGNNLYITFDAQIIDFSNFTASVVIAPMLYQVNPGTGVATPIGPTDLGIGAVTGVNGTYYAFDDNTGQINALDLATGNTRFVTNFDPSAGIVQGALPAPVPEPATFALLSTGLAGLVACKRRGR